MENTYYITLDRYDKVMMSDLIDSEQAMDNLRYSTGTNYYLELHVTTPLLAPVDWYKVWIF